MIVRIVKNKSNPFVMMDKRPLEDRRLSFKAKGVLAYLLSRPDDWTVIVTDIMNQATDGRESVQGALRELKKHGYAKIRSVQGPGGRMEGREWVISEIPEPPADERLSRLSVSSARPVHRPTALPSDGETATTNTNRRIILTKTKKEEATPLSSAIGVEVPSPEPAEAPKQPEPVVVPPSVSGPGVRANQLIKLWMDGFEAFHGIKYVMQGGKDAGQALLLCKSTNMLPSEMMEVATRAWRRGKNRMQKDRWTWVIQKATTITGFATNFSDISLAVGWKSCELPPASVGDKHNDKYNNANGATESVIADDLESCAF